ncbi:phosphotransferase family protein [Oleiagrimonas sp.]|jgi:aminoglycoside phosphotransferase (APT) family kinase protein|uniref:phosphotransferase family protein n=1 Tax=Oleiagrimonas sp. TaxID=2010330 RepID=UPI0026276048|nr:phosphotransferase family protein [Oleiagrimonas sp.]MDA3915228.1 phosphotransferase family protein [Oleiagrimonas sp.]
MKGLQDRARAVREEDRIEAAAVDRFLKQHLDGLQGAPEIFQFPGGASNLTYLIRYGERELVLRRPPAGAKAHSAHDMLREARVMAALRPHYPYVPEILARCDDPAVLGGNFFVMERLRGVILRRELPDALGLDAAGVRSLCEGFIDRMVDLHHIDASAPPLADLGKGTGYIARQVAGWSERWRKALTQGSDACEDVLAWLADKQPAHETAICVIHNDYRFDNVVLDPDDALRIVGVLDWEMATLGDPLMDLGGSLAYWVQADDDEVFRSLRRQPTHVPGMMTRREVVDYYSERSGWNVDNFDFHEVFGLFRLMVIIQQIYRRYALGQTHNEQFAGFGQAATTMGQRCRRRIAESDL